MPAFERKFYIPHKAVVKESAETAKMRIVYDASARAWLSSLPKRKVDHPYRASSGKYF